MAKSQKLTAKLQTKNQSLQTTNQKPNTTNHPPIAKKPFMCSSFKQFGHALLAIGAVFFAMNFLFGATFLRYEIVTFFIALGIIDLLAYSKYGEG